MADPPAADVRVEFIAASTWHGSLERADALLAAHPELAGVDIHVAAILGDADGVRVFLASDPGCVHAKSAPYGAIRRVRGGGDRAARCRGRSQRRLLDHRAAC
jgi:hypothetical protein